MRISSSSPPSSAHESLVGQYQASPNVYDEMVGPDGSVRPFWQPLLGDLDAMGREHFERRQAHASRLVSEDGIAYGPNRDESNLARRWELDAMPVLIPRDEWQQVGQALIQRARLLERVLSDLSGPQETIKRGLLPANFLFAHPRFLRPCCGTEPAGGRYLQIFAADLQRTSDGTWRILADRTEAPSGSGYALENRIVTSRVLPRPFHGCHVERLAPFFIALKEALHTLAPRHQENPRVVWLSPGPENPNFFEDAYLARYLGYTLVQGGDLAVRDNEVMLKTLGGLLPVDVLVRRPNTYDCDPLEFPGGADRGAAGLLEAWRCHQLAIVNPPGSGLVESRALMAYLPRLCRELLGEELLINNLQTWWCGEAESKEFVLNNLENLSVRPAYRQRLDRAARNALQESSADDISAQPERYVACQPIVPSTTPVWSAGTWQTGHAVVRAYVVLLDDSYVVMQGGLARVSLAPESAGIAKSARTITKDVWIVSDAPVSTESLLQKSAASVTLRRSGAEFPSRVADNLFWLGRHIERAEATARLWRTVATRLSGEIESAALPELPALLRALASQGAIEPGFAVEEMRDQLPAVETALPFSIFDENQAGSLRCILGELLRVASLVRERISSDSWHITRHLEQLRQTLPVGPTSLSDTLGIIGEVILNLAALNGLVMESMVRSQAWRFLDLGRRLERALQSAQLIKACVAELPDNSDSLLESVLEVADSLLTYRSRYLANLQLAPVLDLLLTDETNPRAVAYQLVSISQHVEQLPRDRALPSYAVEQRITMSLLHELRMLPIVEVAELHGLGEHQALTQILDRIESQLPALSDAISHQYLVHVKAAQQLSEILPH